MKFSGSFRFFVFRNNQRGSLLILALSSLVVLSLLAFSVGYTVRQKLQVVTRLEDRNQLRLAGEAALQRGLEVLFHYVGDDGSSDFHALNQLWSRNSAAFKNIDWGQAEVSIIAVEESKKEEPQYGFTDEESKINLNTAKPDVLQNLIMFKGGVDREDARRIVSAIRDWKDKDEDLTDGGAESKDYQRLKVPYKSQNAPFNALKELLWVQGMNPTIYAKIAPYLTLEGKKINLNTAPGAVLRSMGLNLKTAEQILAFRAGKDGLEGTSDDGVFEDLSLAPQTLTRYHYMDDAEIQTLKSVLSSGFSVQSDFFSAQIFARRKGGRANLKITAVVNKRGDVMRWFEEFS